MSQQKKALDLLSVYDKLYESLESFEPIAIHLCYLMGAILKDSYIELDLNIDRDAEFYKVLGDAFGSDHFIWNYIKLYKR